MKKCETFSTFSVVVDTHKTNPRNSLSSLYSSHMHFTICFTFLHTFFFTFIQEQLWRLNNSIHSRWNVIYALPLFNKLGAFLLVACFSSNSLRWTKTWEHLIVELYFVSSLFQHSLREFSRVFFEIAHNRIYTTSKLWLGMMTSIYRHKLQQKHRHKKTMRENLTVDRKHDDCE